MDIKKALVLNIAGLALLSASVKKSNIMCWCKVSSTLNFWGKG